MATSYQLRQWWASYECATSKMTTVSFPGEGRTWNLLVAAPSKPIWEAAAAIMRSEPYLFREVAGGTYNCRPPSLHAYGLALDLNPSVNPFECPMQTDMPSSFIARMEGIRANGKQALQWGGRWPCENPPDPMHYQINVAPADCKNVTWDQDEEYEMTPAQFAARLSIEQVKAICNQKGEGGVWVISPADPNRTTVTNYFVGLLNNPSSSDWVSFYEEVQTEALVNAAIRKAGPSAGAAVPLTVELKGTAKP